MANLSNYAESGLLNFWLRSNSNSFKAPLTIAIALCSGVPAKSCTGGNLPEIANAGGYARVNLGAPANSIFTDWTQVSVSGNINNVSTITFPTATSYWGWVSGVGILDSGTYGSGNLLLWASLSTPREILNGDTYTISSANLNIYLG